MSPAVVCVLACVLFPPLFPTLSLSLSLSRLLTHWRIKRQSGVPALPHGGGCGQGLGRAGTFAECIQSRVRVTALFFPEKLLVQQLYFILFYHFFSDFILLGLMVVNFSITSAEQTEALRGSAVRLPSQQLSTQRRSRSSRFPSRCP